MTTPDHLRRELSELERKLEGLDPSNEGTSSDDFQDVRQQLDVVLDLLEDYFETHPEIDKSTWVQRIATTYSSYKGAVGLFELVQNTVAEVAKLL